MIKLTLYTSIGFFVVDRNTGQHEHLLFRFIKCKGYCDMQLAHHRLESLNIASICHLHEIDMEWMNTWTRLKNQTIWNSVKLL